MEAIDPMQLLALIAARQMPPFILTFAAEIVGRRCDDSAAVRAALLPLLDYPSSVVREGAIYGLARHLDDDARAQLARVAAADPSFAVRAVAAEAIEPC